MNWWTFYDRDCIASQTIDPDFQDISAKKIISTLANPVTCVEYVPTCPQTNTVMVYTQSTCMQATTVGASGSELFIVPCVTGKGKCVSEYRICYDNSFTPPKLIQNRTSYGFVGVCPVSIVLSGPIPLPGYYPSPYSSPCYYICN